MLTLNEIVALAKEVESEDPIDWSYLNIDEDTAYKLIGLNVFEMYNDWKESGQSEDIMLVTITKLIVENFALNTRLLQREQ